MHKISFIGLGRVAKEAIKWMAFSEIAEKIHLTFIVKNVNSAIGFLLDIEDCCTLEKGLSYNVSDNLKDIINSDLVVITAGKTATTELKNELCKDDPSGRLSQTYANYRMVLEFGKAINAYSPKATVLTVTNHSDLLSTLLRKYCPTANIIGMGCMLDTSRFRNILCDYLKKSHFGNIKIELLTCGIHDENVFVIRNNLCAQVDNNIINIDNQLYDKILFDTIKRGKKISNYNKINCLNINSGAYLLPGICIFKFIKSFFGDIPLIDSFNVVINDDDISRIYQLPQGRSLSIPVIINNGTIKGLKEVILNQSEQEKVKQISSYINEQVFKLEQYENKRN